MKLTKVIKMKLFFFFLYINMLPALGKFPLGQILFNQSKMENKRSLYHYSLLTLLENCMKNFISGLTFYIVTQLWNRPPMLHLIFIWLHSALSEVFCGLGARRELVFDLSRLSASRHTGEDEGALGISICYSQQGERAQVGH